MEMDETRVASRNISLNDMDEGKEALTHFIGCWCVCIYIASNPTENRSIGVSFTQIATAEEGIS